MMRPNLVPVDLLERRRARRALLAWTRVVATLALVATGANLAVWDVARRHGNTRDALRDEVHRLEARVVAGEALARDRVALRRESELLETARRATPVHRILDAVGSALPPGAYLTTLDLQRPPLTAPDPPPEALTLIGRAPTLGDVGTFLRGLRSSQTVGTVTLTGTGDTRARVGAGEITFEVACRPREGSDG